MLGQLSWKDEPDCGLDLSGGDSWLLVVAGQAGSLSGDLLEDVVDERVQDRHSLAGDTGVGVHLYELSTGQQRFETLRSIEGWMLMVGLTCLRTL